MPKLMLDRQTLARLLQNDHQAIVAFEKVLGDVGETLPNTLEEVTALASMASSLANLALAMLAKTDEQLELLNGLPTPVAPPTEENYIPAIAFGTIGQQNADAVEITGGSIDGTTIGATSASTGAFTTLTATGQITSTLASGTAPLVVASVTKVANLNADLLDGTDWAAPGPIGGTTPGSASFTTISASGQITSTLATGTAPLVIASTTQVANLNASQLVGATWVAPGTIGSTTPNTGAFTTLSATGLFDISAAGAGQIKFPATQNPSSDANTLDDYEEGNWTATFTTTGTQPATPPTATCKYTKIGRVVTVHMVIANFTVSGATGNISIAGLPFSSSFPATGAVWSWAMGATPMVARIDSSTTSIQLATQTDNNAIPVTNGANQYLYITISYLA